MAYRESMLAAFFDELEKISGAVKPVIAGTGGSVSTGSQGTGVVSESKVTTPAPTATTAGLKMKKVRAKKALGLANLAAAGTTLGPNAAPAVPATPTTSFMNNQNPAFDNSSSTMGTA